MPARCLGSIPPPISRSREGGEDARYEAGRTVARLTCLRRRPHHLFPDPLPQGWERPNRAARTAQDLKG